MTKTNKILLSVGAIALAYYLWKQKDSDKNFSNLTTSGGGRSCVHLFCPCGCHDRNGVGHCTPPSLCPK